jgi:hypothetical protein
LRTTAVAYARLAGLGAATTTMIEEAVRDDLKAVRWVTFTCSRCGKRNRVRVNDMSARLAASKLAADLSARRSPRLTTPTCRRAC